MDFYKQVFDFIKFQSNNTLPQTKGAFKALVDVIIPGSALDSHIDEYLIWSLDHYLSLKILIDEFPINIANLTAGLMNTAAQQLIYTGRNKKPVNKEIEAEEGTFAALAPIDRLRAITILENLEVDIGSLPIPFNIYPSFALSSCFSLALLTILGYYTEWSGYGSTRMETPVKRQLEHFPTGWQQVGYPGVSHGYRVLRGHLVKKFSE